MTFFTPHIWGTPIIKKAYKQSGKKAIKVIIYMIVKWLTVHDSTNVSAS